MPIELASETMRQTYRTPVRTMTLPIDGHPNWGEAMEVCLALASLIYLFLKVGLKVD